MEVFSDMLSVGEGGKTAWIFLFQTPIRNKVALFMCKFSAFYNLIILRGNLSSYLVL